MFNLSEYLLSSGMDPVTVNFIEMRLSIPITINSVDDFKNYTPEEIGIPPMFARKLESAGIVFKG